MLQVEPPSAELRQPGGGGEDWGGVGGVQRTVRPPPAAGPLQPPAPLLPSHLPVPAPPASLICRHSLVFNLFFSLFISEVTSAGRAPPAGPAVGAAAQSGPGRQEEGETTIWISKHKVFKSWNRIVFSVGESIIRWWNFSSIGDHEPFKGGGNISFQPSLFSFH